MILPQVLFFVAFFLFTLSQLRLMTLELGCAVNVTISTNIMPFSTKNEVALHVDEGHQYEQVKRDARQDSDVSWVARWPTELGQANDKVYSRHKEERVLDLLVTACNCKGWS